jgi:hypothetical protein
VVAAADNDRLPIAAFAPVAELRIAPDVVRINIFTDPDVELGLHTLPCHIHAIDTISTQQRPAVNSVHDKNMKRPSGLNSACSNTIYVRQIMLRGTWILSPWPIISCGAFLDIAFFGVGRSGRCGDSIHTAYEVSQVLAQAVVLIHRLR